MNSYDTPITSGSSYDTAADAPERAAAVDCGEYYYADQNDDYQERRAAAAVYPRICGGVLGVSSAPLS